MLYTLPLVQYRQPTNNGVDGCTWKKIVAHKISFVGFTKHVVRADRLEYRWKWKSRATWAGLARNHCVLHKRHYRRYSIFFFPRFICTCSAPCTHDEKSLRIKWPRRNPPRGKTRRLSTYSHRRLFGLPKVRPENRIPRQRRRRTYHSDVQICTQTFRPAALPSSLSSSSSSAISQCLIILSTITQRNDVR